MSSGTEQMRRYGVPLTAWLLLAGASPAAPATRSELKLPLRGQQLTLRIHGARGHRVDRPSAHAAQALITPIGCGAP